MAPFASPLPQPLLLPAFSMPSRSRQQARPNRRPKNGERPSGERLQKVLAAAGVGSRRDCEELIVEGRVEVDRKVVRELGTRVDPNEHEIRVDGVALTIKRRLYFLLNKPEGVVTTNRDPDGRPRVIDLIRCDDRLFAVGRLDMSSEGLILMTNDGEIANKLAHPRYGVQKTYLARVVGAPSRDMLDKLKAGVHLAEGVARVADVRVKKSTRQSTDLEIILDEGKNREIRRLLAAVGHKVQKLKRIAIGPLRLGELPTGAYRPLTQEEVRTLEKFLKEGKGAGGKRARPGKRPFGKRAADSDRGLASERPARRSEIGRSGERDAPRPERPPRLPDSATQGTVLGSEGVPRRENPDRPGKPMRAERPARAARPVRAERPGRAGKPARGGKFARGEKPASGQRPDARRKKTKGKRRP